jgi:hypothetical protein
MKKTHRKMDDPTEQDDLSMRAATQAIVRVGDGPPAKLGSRIAARFRGVGLKQEIAELRGR